MTRIFWALPHPVRAILSLVGLTLAVALFVLALVYAYEVVLVLLIFVAVVIAAVGAWHLTEAD